MALIKSVPNEAAAAPSGIADARRFNRQDCSALVAQLNAPDPETRRWAARDLADCEGCATEMVQRLHLENDASVREVILTTLTRLGDQLAVQGLVEFLRSEDVVLRNEAIEAMQQLPLAVAPIMRCLLKDEDSDVRIFTVNILESLRHPDVERWLTEVITEDAHVNVCATAVDLLGEVGSRDALGPLQQLKARFAAEPYIQFAADLAIKRILEG